MWFCTIVDVQLTKLSKSTTFVVLRNQTCFKPMATTKSCQRNHLTLKTAAYEFCLPFSVTRLGDFLHFGQPFKSGGNNYFRQIAHIVRQFL